jgi:hypothetical protein
MTNFTISVDYSNSYSDKGSILARNVVKVNVDSTTTVDRIKETVLGHLKLPYGDLYFLAIKGKKLEGSETVSSLGFSEKTVLVLRCSDLNILFERMRKDHRL